MTRKNDPTLTFNNLSCINLDRNGLPFQKLETQTFQTMYSYPGKSSKIPNRFEVKVWSKFAYQKKL